MVATQIRKPHRWSEQETDLLRREYDGSSRATTHLMGILGLRRSQIRTRASYIGVTRHLFITHVKWDDSPEALHKFGELLQRYSLAKVGKIYGVSSSAVAARAARKRVNKQLRHGWYTVKDVGLILNVNPQTITTWIQTGLLKATNHFGKNQGYEGGACWYHIEEKDLKEFILHHRYEFYNRRVDLGAVLDIVLNGNFAGK